MGKYISYKVPKRYNGQWDVWNFREFLRIKGNKCSIKATYTSEDCDTIYRKDIRAKLEDLATFKINVVVEGRWSKTYHIHDNYHLFIIKTGEFAGHMLLYVESEQKWFLDEYDNLELHTPLSVSALIKLATEQKSYYPYGSKD